MELIIRVLSFILGLTLISDLTNSFKAVEHTTECDEVGVKGTDLLLNGLLYSKLPAARNNISDSCLKYVLEFGDGAAMFIKCSVDSARPFRFCEKCYCHYVRASYVYGEIVKSDEKKDNCNNLLLNADKVQIINDVQSSIEKIWDDADCKQCFSTLNEENGTVHAVLTQEAKDFLALYRNFTACINETEAISNETVCDRCRHFYRAMNNKFDDMLNDKFAPQHVCMDIVDMMNYTRLTWGNDLNCTVVHRQIGGVVAAMVVIFLSPPAFYASFAVYGAKRTRSLMRQKRLQSYAYGSIDSPHTETINEDPTSNHVVPNHLPTS